MNRPASLGFVAFLVGCAFVSTLWPHDEPPKTHTEILEQAKARDNFRKHGVRQQQLWTLTHNDDFECTDSTLLLLNRFDHSGNLVEQTVFDSVGNSRSVSLYDSQNLWLEELSYIGDSLEERNIFVYNAGGLIHNITSYDSQGRLVGQLDYHYQDSARQILVTKTGPADSIQYFLTYSYEPKDGFEHQSEAIQKNPDGSLRIRALNHYEGNQRSSKQVFGPDGTVSHSFKYFYTDEGELREIQKYLPGDSLVTRQIYQYEPNGLLSTIAERDASGAIQRTLRYIYGYTEETR